MALLKPNSNVDNNEIKRGEEILKSIIGGKLVRNREFYKKMNRNGIINTPKAWHKIDSQIRRELKDGQLSPDDIEKRIDELILEISGRTVIMHENDTLIQDEAQVKQLILREGQLSIQIPYQASGIGGSVRGGAVFGQTGAFFGSLEEGTTKWKRSELLFIDGGISIKSTGQVVLYENINKVVLNEEKVFTVVTVITDSGENMVYKTVTNGALASKSIIEDNIPQKSHQIHQTVRPTNNVSSADELLKYAELYEKGLITREEFDKKKEQLMNGSQEEIIESEPIIEPEQSIENKPLFCSNCGNRLESDSNFCPNCGSQIK